MRIAPLRNIALNSFIYKDLNSGKKSWEWELPVDTSKFSRTWKNLKDNEYIYIYITDKKNCYYQTVPVYGIVVNKADRIFIRWHKISDPKKYNDINNNVSFGKLSGTLSSKWYMGTNRSGIH